jgi:Spy/CpxP family protein refolding chaperone
MQFLKSCVCLGLIVAVSGGAVGDEKQAKKQKGKGRNTPTATQRLVSKLELTDAQKEQVAAIDKEFMAKFKEITDARNAILTTEQLNAEKEARKVARTAGKSQADTKKSVDEAIALTTEQKEKMKAWSKTQKEFEGQVVVALKKVLTPEQQEQLPKPKGEKGKKKKDAK